MTALPSPETKARTVQGMFDRIAPRYDLVNRVMTLNRDQRWRRDLLARLAIDDRDTVLDLACGTGDFLILAREQTSQAVGVDFAGAMLRQAAKRCAAPLRLVQGDALRLPFATGSMTVAVSGFALRNFSAIPPVLAELARVLAPGGRLGLLEVDRPRNRLVRAGHGLYFGRVVPLVGGLLSADSTAYRYLPESAAYLPTEPELVRMLVGAGFHRVQKRRPMFGAIQAVTAVRR